MEDYPAGHYLAWQRTLCWMENFLLNDALPLAENYYEKEANTTDLFRRGAAL
jgi:hypothetical protein